MARVVGLTIVIKLYFCRLGLLFGNVRVVRILWLSSFQSARNFAGWIGNWSTSHNLNLINYYLFRNSPQRLTYRLCIIHVVNDKVAWVEKSLLIIYNVLTKNINPSYLDSLQALRSHRCTYWKAFESGNCFVMRTSASFSGPSFRGMYDFHKTLTDSIRSIHKTGAIIYELGRRT